MKRIALFSSLTLALTGLTIGAFSAGRASAQADDGGTIIVRHSVASFEKWKPGFDGHEATRKKFGWTGHTVLTEEGDPTHVVIVGKVKSLARAKEFAKDPTLKEVMQKAGVISPPDIAFLKVAEQKSY